MTAPPGQPPADLALPDTPLAAQARAVAESVYPVALRNHALRTYLLGRAYARRFAIAHDAEGLFVASLFHDLGLTQAHRDRRVAFTLAASRLLEGFLARQGVEADRARALADAIDYHMQPLPRWSKGAVCGLLQVGAWMDITWLRRWRVRRAARAIEAAWPRRGIGLAFPVALVRSIGSFASVGGLVCPACFGARSGG